MRTALILLGGMATRAGYRAKYLFKFQGETFLDRQIRVLRTVTDEIVISCRDQDQADSIPHSMYNTIVTDVRSGIGPTEGIRTGARAAKGDLIFVIACDMPLISTEVIEYLFNQVGTTDAAIPGWKNGSQEPLHAVYRRDALVHAVTEESSRRLRDITSTLQVTIIPVEDLKRFDPLLQIFTNINDMDSFTQLTEKKEIIDLN